MHTPSPFQLAIPVNDLASCRTFYRDTLGCKEGRSSEHWVDFNFFGHQLVIHLKQDTRPKAPTNTVDGKEVPIPHFGVVLDMDTFNELAKQLQEKNVEFIIAPCTRFKGLVGEQATMFFKDPSANALEFKAFADPSQLFAS